jgi:hypothetical protein
MQASALVSKRNPSADLGESQRNCQIVTPGAFQIVVSWQSAERITYSHTFCLVPAAQYRSLRQQMGCKLKEESKLKPYILFDKNAPTAFAGLEIGHPIALSNTLIPSVL